MVATAYTHLLPALNVRYTRPSRCDLKSSSNSVAVLFDASYSSHLVRL
jgi:hypothetical protein